MPRTSHNASIHPKGPAESRLAMMRAARAGPIPGSDSIVAESARSRSMGIAMPEAGWGAPRVCARGRPAFDAPRRGRGFARTESTRPSCRSSAATASDSAGRLARHIRTLLPDSATMARNQRALRSLGVAIPQVDRDLRPIRHLTSAHSTRNTHRPGKREMGNGREKREMDTWGNGRRCPAIPRSRGPSLSFRLYLDCYRVTRVSATSPTTWRDCALILSIVSSCVWCRLRLGSPPHAVPPSRQ